jgi:DNA polymerase-3 subunit gamma/tau
MASYQSLYRRYRPQRFDEVLGQAHVTKALRNAVRDDRVGHAYLFSGPRGTGKTSTARILAKVLNCDSPTDGEPCGKCDNCVSVAEGRVTDWLLEQDAASKSKVDDMRDLLERVPLGTSGNRKVIILDEVHMLSQGAENALLKTLEEPPSHVVFILATTDPQKVRPTIRSRTQHFEFRLLPPDVMGDHVRHVIEDSGIDAGDIDAAVDHVIRSGGGSARDTLSALDQVAALGEVVDESHPVDAILEGLCARDPGQVLVAVADALASGRDPRALGEAVIAGLRDAFLSVMGVAETHLAPADRARAAHVGERLGPAGLTRALDVLGEALVELARKPDPRIVVEVALVRLTQPSSDRTVDALVERVDRLERMGGSGGSGGSGGAGAVGGPPAGAGPSAPRSDTTGSGSASRPAAADGGAAPAAPPTSAEPGGDIGGDIGGGIGASAARDALSSVRGGRSAGAGDDAGTGTADAATPARGSGRPTLGAVARGRRGQKGGNAGGAGPAPEAGSPVGAASPDPAPGTATGTAGRAAPPTPGPAAPAASTPTATTPTGATTAAPATTGTGALPTVSEVEAAWAGEVLASLPVKIRSKWRGGRWIEPDDASLRFAVPNAWHQNACDEFRRDVEQALGSRFGRSIAVTLVVEGDPPPSDPSRPSGPPVAPLGGGQGGASKADDDGDEHIDPSDLRDADDVATSGVDLLMREFGGGEVIQEEP